jgi:acyl-CoA dehydrogenase
MSRTDPVAALLAPADPAPRCDTAADWLPVWHAAQAAHADADPFDAAVLAASLADRVAWAFFCGYQGALQAVFGAAAGRPAAFCANESGRRITEVETALRRDGDALRLDGRKSWALTPSEDTTLLARARAADGPASGPGSLAVVRVPLSAAGVARETGSPQRVVPELPHAALRLEGVPVSAAEVLPGDGYADHAKPFGLVESVFIHGCVLAALLAEARADAWHTDWCERALAAIASLGEGARRDVRAPSTVVLATGALALADAVLREVDAHRSPARGAERERWQRDAPLLSLGRAARAQRVRTAWAALDAGPSPDAVPGSGRGRLGG